jgi:hypothetical protein
MSIGVYTSRLFLSSFDFSPECCLGSEWTPNDPVFFLRHAVRVFHLSADFILTIYWFTGFAYMVNKLWYNWQNGLPMKKCAFDGESVSAFGQFTTFNEFPTGLPPFLLER